MGLTRGVFLCHRRDANTSRMLSSGVFRICFSFSAVVIRLSYKCRLKSTLRGSSTFTAERLSGDSPTFGDSRGATSPPTLRLPATPSDSTTPSDYQTISDFRLSTCGVLGTLTPCAAITHGMPRVVDDRPRAPGAAKARPNAALYIGAIDKRKSLEKLLTHKQKHLLYEYKQKRLYRRRRKRPRSPKEGTT